MLMLTGEMLHEKISVPASVMACNAFVGQYGT
jgi:hypothetical protein